VCIYETLFITEYVTLFYVLYGGYYLNYQEDESQTFELIDILALLLDENSAGFSEHELLKLLQQPPHEFFATDALHDPLVLFQTHFLLFHCLYVLKQRWSNTQHAELEISALVIKKQIFKVSTKNTQLDKHKYQPIEQADPLAQYYLDWSHFSATSSADVEELLSSFWRKVFKPQNALDIQQALIIMELEAPTSTIELKVQYRRLAQNHHPDKGGDSEHFKNICQAFHQLKQYNALST